MDKQRHPTHKERAAQVVKQFQDDGHPYYDELLSPIEEALVGAVMAEREECCKAMCEFCAAGAVVEYQRNNQAWMHPKAYRDEVTGWTYATCRANAIRERSRGKR